MRNLVMTKNGSPAWQVAIRLIADSYQVDIE